MSNLDLWHSVERTDPAHTKPITGKAYSGNSPKPHFIIFKATETFGPCGIGWGFEIIEEKLLEGAMLEPGFYEKIHMARIRVWYEWNGKRGTVEHVGQTVFSGRRSAGKPFTDEDAPKKSVTDGLIKALSMIGFAGDIFLGRYDDSKYVSELKREIAEEKAPPPPPAPSKPSAATPAEEQVAVIRKKATIAAIDRFRSLPEVKRDFDLMNAEDKAWVNSADEAQRAAIESGAMNLTAG